MGTIFFFEDWVNSHLAPLTFNESSRLIIEPLEAIEG